MSVEAFFEIVTIIFEVVGVLAMSIGFLVAVVIALRTWATGKDGQAAFKALRDTLGLVILLGLEILVAADIVRTVTSTPSITEALVLALVVLIRTVLSFSLQIEIDGVAPWRRALMTSPELMVKAASSASKALPVTEPAE
jgi:uncharacterized membrane protein